MGPKSKAMGPKSKAMGPKSKAMGPKSKRKGEAGNPLEAANLMGEVPATNGAGNPVSEPESSPVKSKGPVNPFEIANDVMYSDDDNDDDDDMALTSIISNSVGGAKSGGPAKK